MSKKWRRVLLGDVINLKRGYDLPERLRIRGNVPIVTSAGESGLHNESKVKGPGVVTGRYGTLGEVFYVKKDYWPHNTTLYVQDFKGNHPHFISYFLRTLGFANQNAAGAVPGVNRNHLHRLEVAIPDVTTQRKIASILSAYDDLIENNTRRIAILEEMAQAIYREWFVNFRFPGHENVKLVQSTLGMIPEGWKTDRLSALADVNARSIKNDLVPDCINYIDIASVSTGRINEIRPMTFAEAPGRARRIVRHGDVIWSTVRPNRRSYCIVIDPSPDTIASTGFAVLSPLSVPFSYLYYAVTTDDFASYLVNHATGSAYPAVSSKDFSDAELILPSTRLLQSFHGVVEETLLLSHRLQKKNRILGATRDLLLPKLISGLLDVEDLDIDTGLTAEELEEATA